MIRSIRKHRLFSAVLISFALAAASAPAAQADSVPINEGSVEWGVLDSWRAYVVYFGGTTTVAGGAQLCNPTTCVGRTGEEPDEFLRFPIVSGAFDDATNAFELDLGGSVTFSIPDHHMNLVLTNLRIEMQSDVSVLRADASSVPYVGGDPEEWPDTVIVELLPNDSQLSVVPPLTTWTSIPTALTAEGRAMFGGFYDVGGAMDPVTISYTGPGGPLASTGGSHDIVVTKSPEPYSVDVGSRHEGVPVTFESDATSDEPYTIQWERRMSGQSFTPIEGATEKNYSFTATAADSGYYYQAVYTSSSDAVTTSRALLTIQVVDTIAPTLTLLSPIDGSTTTAASVNVSYLVSDNDSPEPSCLTVGGGTLSTKNGASFPLALGDNKFTISCQDDARNLTIKSVVVKRVPPDPAAPVVKNGGTTKLKYKKGRAAKVNLGSVTCASQSTCVYTLTKSIRIKVGKKRYTLKVKGPATLEPGQTGKLSTSIPANVVKAIKRARKSVRLVVKVQVSNVLKTRHERAKNSISNVR